MEPFEELDSIPMNIRDKIENNLRKGIIKLVIASDANVQKKVIHSLIKF